MTVFGARCVDLNWLGGRGSRRDQLVSTSVSTRPHNLMDKRVSRVAYFFFPESFEGA